ncbi:MAG: RagB/SusD family nutrient uptake outer membrane protein [Bacteroidaceae bacterium]|nr:RagB/SusD family nutrient uptake outer membrane protein [Bacteroidaceae bacterium]
MMKKNIISILLLAFVSGFGFTSCEDMLSPDMDRHNEVDAIASDTLYSYWGILKELQAVSERYVILGECRGDLVAPTEYISDSIHAILDFGTTGDVTDGSNRYLRASDFYKVINSCNAYIAQCDTLKKTGTNQSVMRKEYAQVASIRAWVYLQLILTYGEVPYFDTPMLSTADMEDYWNNNKSTVNADNFASSLVVQQLQEVRDVDRPNYGNYTSMCHSTLCLFPQNLVLGDIYLLKAKQGQQADYAQAAQYYYDYFNTKVGGVLPANDYFGVLSRSSLNEQINLASAKWEATFGQNTDVTSKKEVITVIPSSKSKLWGSVQRGIQELFGFDSEISVNSTSEDTLTVVSVNLSPNFEHQLGHSQAYKDLNDAQVYEAYLTGSGQNICTVIPGASDARYKMSVDNRTDTEHGDGTEEVTFVMKQNLSYSSSSIGGMVFVSQGITFPTAYPIIYRKGNVWLRFAEALNGAGYPGYAFAILKSGLCGNSQWLPTSEQQYEPSSYVFYDRSEITAAGDTTFYSDATSLLYHMYQRAVASGADFSATTLAPTTAEEMLEIYAKAAETDESGNYVNTDERAFYEVLSTFVTANSADIFRKATAYYEWMSESNTNVVCNHISKREMMNAKSTPYLNFSTLYLRGESDELTYYANGGETQYMISGQVAYPNNNGNFNGEPVTSGIHARGCGHIFFDEQNTTFNYVDQINKMLAEDGEATMTKAEIYDEANLSKVQKAVAHLILDEEALETAFEGNRFFDLVRYSRFCGSADELARRVASRDGSLDATLYSRLQTEANWYFPLPQ